MTHDISDAVVDELDDLLEAERIALLSGNLDEVQRLFERKTRLMDQFGSVERSDADAVQSYIGQTGLLEFTDALDLMIDIVYRRCGGALINQPVQNVPRH